MRGTLAGWLIVTGILVIGLCSLDAGDQILVRTVLGWALFLLRVVPQVRPGWSALLTGLLCLALLAVGLHLLLRWVRPGWTLRWTFSVLAGVVLAFITGLAAHGIVQQGIWLATSKKALDSFP